MEYTRLSHCVYHLQYHLIIATKYRRKIFNEGIFAYFDTKLAEITSHYPLIKFIKVNHGQDHIHLLISIPPVIPVSKVVGIIKQNTAKSLKQKFPFLKDVYWGSDSVWSQSYFVATVGLDEKIIKKYIQEQGNEETGQTLFSSSN